MKWAVEVQRTTLERRNLEDLLAGLGFSLIDGVQFPALTSKEIDQSPTVALKHTKDFADLHGGRIALRPRWCGRDLAIVQLCFGRSSQTRSWT